MAVRFSSAIRTASPASAWHYEILDDAQGFLLVFIPVVADECDIVRGARITEFSYASLCQHFCLADIRVIVRLQRAAAERIVVFVRWDVAFASFNFVLEKLPALFSIWYAVPYPRAAAYTVGPFNRLHMLCPYRRTASVPGWQNGTSCCCGCLPGWNRPCTKAVPPSLCHQVRHLPALHQWYAGLHARIHPPALRPRRTGHAASKAFPSKNAYRFMPALLRAAYVSLSVHSVMGAIRWNLGLSAYFPLGSMLCRLGEAAKAISARSPSASVSGVTHSSGVSVWSLSQSHTMASAAMKLSLDR